METENELTVIRSFAVEEGARSFQEILADRRASGWLPTGAIAELVGQPVELVEQSLGDYGNPKVDDNGSFFRWNWVYEWAIAEFDVEANGDAVRELAGNLLARTGGDLDLAMSAATDHIAKLRAADIVEATLDING